jgi:hypothetical protein
MKFFTPDLLARFGSADDATADAAHREWEQADGKYRKRLDRIRAKLPPAARELTRRFCLHDARLLTLGVRDDYRSLFLFLSLDTPDGEGLLLEYDLVKRPQILKHPSLSEPGTPLEWLYDEFGVGRGRGHPTFKHSILFTGGRELDLTFRGLRLRLFKKVLVPTTGESGLDALLAS